MGKLYQAKWKASKKLEGRRHRYYLNWKRRQRELGLAAPYEKTRKGRASRRRYLAKLPKAPRSKFG